MGVRVHACECENRYLTWLSVLSGNTQLLLSATLNQCVLIELLNFNHKMALVK